MILRRIFVIAFALFTVTLNTACPRDIANSIIENDKLVKDYNSKRDESNQIQIDLRNNYNVWVGPNSKASAILIPDWKAMDPSKRAEVRNKLHRYNELISGMIEISHNKNVKGKVTPEPDESDLQERLTSGTQALASLDKAEAEIAATK